MSDYVMNTIGTFYGSKFLKKVIKFPIGIFERNFHDCKARVEDSKKIIFFTLRRLEPRMGLENLLMAIKYLVDKTEDKNFIFLIGGIGVLETKLKQIAKDLAISEFVKFEGYLSEEQKALNFASSDAFVLPTEDLEGFGIVIIEALAFNLPVIATNAGAIPEVLNPICPELVADGTDPLKIANRIAYFLNNIQRYKNTTKFYDYAFACYRWESLSKLILAEYINIYHENINH